MPATTFEEIIATHSDMIGRHRGHTTLGAINISDFIATLTDLGQVYATGLTASLQAAGEDFTAAANYLTDAEHDTTHANVLIGLADKHLHDVADYALA